MLTQYGETSQLVKQLFSLAWTASTNGLVLGGGMDVLGDFGWGLLLFAGLGVIAFRSTSREIKFLWIYTVIHTLAWSTSKPVLRFLFGIAPIFILLSSC